MRRAISLGMLLGVLLGSHSPRVLAEGEVASLLQRVVIYRDTWGIPHVFGETEEAALFGDGYAQGQERGRLILPAILRAAQRRPVSTAQFRTLPAEVQRAIEAFTAGLNFYLREHRAALPEGVREVTKEEVTAWLRGGGGFARPRASNSFVVSGKRMVSGKTVVVADPHRPFTQTPEIHIKGGELNVIGNMLGMFVEIGHNGYIAWGGSAHPHRMVSLGDSLQMIATHYRMMKARSIAELKRALSSCELPQEPHIVAGDRYGHIFYVAFGKIPARDREGFLRFEELPQIEDPPCGFVQTSNEAPWLVCPEGEQFIDIEFYLRHFQPGRRFNLRTYRGTYRGRRLTQLLTSKEKFTLEDIRRFAFDTYVTPAAQLKPLIASACAKAEGKRGEMERDVMRVARLLREWDCVSRTDSTAMTLFKVWFQRYRSLGGEIRPGGTVPLTEAEEARALTALRQTVEFMRRQYGRLEVPWGEVHVLKRGDKEFPMGAADFEFQTVHMASATSPRSQRERYENGKWYCHFGSSYMFLCELGEPVRAWSVKPNSQSDDPRSPHFADQTELFSQRRMKPLWFTEEEVLNHLESAWGVRIKLGTRTLGYEATLTFERPTEVRPVVSKQAPAPLPPGRRAVSPFLTLHPADAKVQGTLRLYLSPAGRGAESVGLYRLRGDTWERVDGSRWDQARNSVQATIALLGTYVVLGRKAEETEGRGARGALGIRGRSFVDGRGRPVRLRGFQVDDPLAYLSADDILRAGRGRGMELKPEDALAYRRFAAEVYLNEADFRFLAGLGVNAIRVALTTEFLETAPYQYDPFALARLRQLADWGQRHGIWIIFELHAAPGGQNTYFHSGGGNRLWDDDEAQARFYALWEKIAEALKGHPGVGAFDLLNEPTPTPFDDPEQATQKLRRIYREATRRIRRVDPHRLVIWANINRWSLWYDPQRPGGFVRSDSPGVAYTFHFYQPGKFTHPRPGRKPITYPGRINGRPFHRGLLDELLRPFVRFARQVEAPLWVGEFGVSRNVPGTSDAAWAADLIDLFESYGFSWSYYRYKNMRWQGPFPLFTLRPEALKRLVAIREAVERYSRGEPDGLDPKTLTAQDAAAFHIDQPVWQVDEPLFEAIRARLARD